MTSTREPVIMVDDLSAEYPAHGASAACVALKGVSVQVMPGEVLGVLGSSGSGKSTLGRIVSGRASKEFESNRGAIPRITGGDVHILDFRVRRLSARARRRLTFHVGYLSQNAASTLPASDTVAEIISSPIFDRDRRYSRQAVGRRLTVMMDMLGMPLKLLQSYPYELSSGQRQRVAIARTMMLDPKVLVVDEPTAGIDVTVRDAVVDLLVDLRSQMDFAALVVSHDLAVLRRVTANIAVLDRGSLVGYGEIDSVLANPSHPYVAQLAETLDKLRQEKAAAE